MTADINNRPDRPPRRLYGDELTTGFGAQAPAPTIVTRSMPHAELAVTELRVDDPAGRISERFGGTDAYMIAHELRSYRGMEYWEDGRHISITTFALAIRPSLICGVSYKLGLKSQFASCRGWYRGRH
jgi:hypothetical protein